MTKILSLITIYALLSGVAFSFVAPINTFTTVIGNQTISQTQYNFTQFVDHFNPNNTSKWQQKLTVYNDSFVPDNGAVFIFIGGEGPENGLSNGIGWVLQLAQQFNGMVVAVEHRFYGVSQPFGQSDTSYSIENLAYLTVDQSLEDLAYVISIMKQNGFLGASDYNPFITIGGSYPGAMSAWFRYKYPHLTIGALASSAVVNSILDFQQYDYQIYTSTLKSGQWCPNRIQKFNMIIEQTLEVGGVGADNLKLLFNATTLTNQEFLGYFGDFWAGMVQYGKRTNLCDMFQSDIYSEQLKNVLAYAAVNQTTDGYDISTLQNTAYVPDSSDRQWVWQVCTYFGWFQTANQVQPMRSRQIDLDFYEKQCSDAFGPEYSVPDVDGTNSNYGGKYLDVPNLIFTNGGEDEWQWASIRQSNLEMEAFISDCTDCGHCVELRLPKPTDSPQLQQTRKSVTDLFTIWISAHFANQDSQKIESTSAFEGKDQFGETYIEKMMNLMNLQNLKYEYDD